MDRFDWLIRWFSVFLAGLVFTLTLNADTLTSPAYLVINQGLFVTLISYLLLPPARGLAGLLSNSAAGVPILIALSQVPIAGMIPLEVLFRICVVILSLSLFLWSLRQLQESVLPNTIYMRHPIFIFITIVTSAPVWLGPIVEIYQPGDSAIDSIISITPLTHFSVAAEYDYLRSEWFYRNTPFGSLPFTYPSLIYITTVYLFLVISFQVILWWMTRHTLDLFQPQGHSLTTS